MSAPKPKSNLITAVMFLLAGLAWFGAAYLSERSVFIAVGGVFVGLSVLFAVVMPKPRPR